MGIWYPQILAVGSGSFSYHPCTPRKHFNNAFGKEDLAIPSGRIYSPGLPLRQMVHLLRDVFIIPNGKCAPELNLFFFLTKNNGGPIRHISKSYLLLALNSQKMTQC